MSSQAFTCVLEDEVSPEEDHVCVCLWSSERPVALETHHKTQR